MEKSSTLFGKRLKTETHEIIESGEFHGSKLLLPNEKGQVTRRSLRYGSSGDAIPNMFASRMVLHA